MSTPTHCADCGAEFGTPMRQHAETEDGRRICYPCAAKLARQRMIDTGRACLYLCQRETEPKLGTIDRPFVRQTMAGPRYYRYELTDWPNEGRFPLLSVRESKGYGFGREFDVVTFRFVGPDGYVWSGRNAGDMQLARCKRTKELFRAPRPTVTA